MFSLHNATDLGSFFDCSANEDYVFDLYALIGG